MPAQLSNTTTQVRTALRVTTFTQHSLDSWHLQLRPAMALVNPGSQPRLDNGTGQAQFRVDTPGDEVCFSIYWLRTTPFVSEPPQYTLTGSWPFRSALCTICAAFLLVTFFFSLFQCCLQLLLVSLCLMSTIFSLNDSASVKYAAGYFSILSSPACSPVLYYPISLCTRFFRISSFLSRVAVSPGLDTLPSTT